MRFHNVVAENVFGVIGTICWTAQLVPQVWKSYHTKSTAGLSHWLVLIWGLSAPLLGSYTILQNLNIPLMVQPQVFGALSFLAWGQCQYYGERRSLRFSILLTVAVIIIAGILELVLVIAIRPSHNRGQQSAVVALGILSSITIAIGLLPQYWEIYKYKEVKGISMLFITIDILGGVFSLLSLVFKERFDALAAVTYSLVIVMDGVIVLAAFVLNPRAKRRRLRESSQALSLNDQPSVLARPDVAHVPSPQLLASPTDININSITSTLVGDIEGARQFEKNGDADQNQSTGLPSVNPKVQTVQDREKIEYEP